MDASVLQWHSDVCAMVDGSTLGFTCECRGRVGLVLIERTTGALHCSIHTDYDGFLRVAHDFKVVCDHMADVHEARVDVGRGWGADVFDKIRREVHGTFLHGRQRLDTDPSVYSMIGGHRGTRSDTGSSQRYGKRDKSQYILLSDPFPPRLQEPAEHPPPPDAPTSRLSVLIRQVLRSLCVCRSTRGRTTV